MNKIIKSILYIIAIIIVVFVGYFLSKDLKNKQPAEIVATTTDPMLESTPTATSTQTAATTTKTVYDEKLGVEFSYPDNFYLNNHLTEYVVPVQWPPTLSVSTSTFSCRTGGKVVVENGKTSLRTIDGKSYCITEASEGAAGSVYTTYLYKTMVNKKNVSINFTIRTPQCVNYDEPKVSECEKEKKDFNIDSLATKVLGSVVFK